MIREWRKFRGLTLERLRDHVCEHVPITAASLSRIERGLQPYSQPILEAIGQALNVEPADLIRRALASRDQLELLSAVQSMTPEQRRLAIRILKAIVEAA